MLADKIGSSINAKAEVALGVEIGELSAMLAELKAQLILTYNMGARVNNTAAKAPDDVLKPLQSAQGKLPAPGVFPLTLEERNTLSNARLDQPAEFYGQSFGAPTAGVSERRTLFDRFISLKR